MMDLKELEKEAILSYRGCEDDENKENLLGSTFNLSIMSKKPAEVLVGPPGKKNVAVTKNMKPEPAKPKTVASIAQK
jgi:hypothetical protein